MSKKLSSTQLINGIVKGKDKIPKLCESFTANPSKTIDAIRGNLALLRKTLVRKKITAEVDLADQAEIKGSITTELEKQSGSKPESEQARELITIASITYALAQAAQKALAASPDAVHPIAKDDTTSDPVQAVESAANTGVEGKFDLGSDTEVGQGDDGEGILEIIPQEDAQGTSAEDAIPLPGEDDDDDSSAFPGINP